MRKIIPVTLLFCSLLSFTAANAQTEFSQLFVKGYVSPGTGAYLDIAIATPGRGNWWMIEPSMEYFYNYLDDYAFVFPTLAGIRHVFNGKCYGFYVEPLAGYTFGSTTIPRTNAAGKPVTNAAGDTVDQKGSGVTTGLGFGYLFPHSGRYNIELRYEHTFHEGHPQIDIIALRCAYTLVFPRNKRYS
jgi:hypothetical protein